MDKLGGKIRAAGLAVLTDAITKALESEAPELGLRVCSNREVYSGPAGSEVKVAEIEKKAICFTCMEGKEIRITPVSRDIMYENMNVIDVLRERLGEEVADYVFTSTSLRFFWYELSTPADIMFSRPSLVLPDRADRRFKHRFPMLSLTRSRFGS